MSSTLLNGTGAATVDRCVIGQTEQTRNFLTAVYNTIPRGSYLLIWTLPDKQSTWCTSVEEAVEVIEGVRGKCNVYFGIGLLGKDFGPTKRGSAKDRIAIPGLWGDFDIAHAAAHKKGNLPPNREAILEVIAEAGLAPTISVNSGHGLQVFWCFEDLWQFSDGEDQAKAETIIRRWNYTLRDLFRKRGWDMDSTFDLARVYRVPGTTNRKVPTEPVSVDIIDLDGPRYTLAEIEPRLIEEDPSQVASRSTAKEQGGVQIADDIVLNPAATVDMERHEMLCEIEPKFSTSWNRKRRDLADQSGSSYDMSLATIAANAGWEDQEIVNLLIAHRRKHNDDLKLRLDYYRMTLHKAKQSVARTQAVERLAEMLHVEDGRISEAGAVPPDRGQRETEQEKKRQAILRHVSDLLGFEITRLVKYTGSEPSYWLETPRGGISLGNVNGLIRQDALRTQVAALTSYYIQKFRPVIWDTIAQSLLNACDEQSTGLDSTEEGEALSWLGSYLSEVGIQDSSKSNADIVCDGSPFVKDNQTWIFGEQFRLWLLRSGRACINSKALSVRLVKCGCKPDDFHYRVAGSSGSPRRKGAWILPAEIE